MELLDGPAALQHWLIKIHSFRPRVVGDRLQKDGEKGQGSGNKLQPRPTHVQDVQGDDVGRGGAQRIGRLHPHLVGGEQSEVAGDVAGVLLLLLLGPGAALYTLRLRLVPPGWSHRFQVPSVSLQKPRLKLSVLFTLFKATVVAD